MAAGLITCPQCGQRSLETIPQDACLHLYVCSACGEHLWPRAGDCCVFCSWADRPCPHREAAPPPKLVDLQWRRQGFASQSTDWPKAGDGPHNLYAPVEHDGGVRGDFVAQSHPRSAYQRLDHHATAASLVSAGVLAVAALAARRSPYHRLATTGLAAAALGFAGKGLLGAFYEG